MLWAALLLSPPRDDTPPSNEDALRGLATWALTLALRNAEYKKKQLIMVRADAIQIRKNRGKAGGNSVSTQFLPRFLALRQGR